GARESNIPPELQERLQDEVGDLLFVLVNLARYLNVDPESALRRTNRKFRARFRHVEDKLREQGKRLEDSNIDEMEEYWQSAKQSE
ncbi:MAG TPA: MazG nucleotide pyrophosphohydrolase domain-containing protein, partial [candidate division Zixibacteria bacterium]|nr:MazG nucleotide pyrophosphohydrolase domain-containing protein [candidate division Zixibacteria bacterium]